jgi:hypothetical protein
MEQTPIDPKFTEAAIEAFLEGHPRAAEWKEWRKALATRLEALREEKKSLPPDADTSEIDAQIAEIERYIAVLDEEAAITEFVEDSIRAAVSATALEMIDSAGEEIEE